MSYLSVERSLQRIASAVSGPDATLLLLPKQLRTDTGEYSPTGPDRMFRAHNCTSEDDSFRSLKGRSTVNEAVVPGDETILDTASVIPEGGVHSLIVTNKKIYVVDATGTSVESTATPATSARPASLTFDNQCQFASIAVLADVYYVASDTNKILQVQVDADTLAATVSELAESPFARTLSNVNNFLVAGATQKDGETEAVVNRVQWSEPNMPSKWVPNVDTGSGDHYFRGIERVVAVTGQGGDLIVFGDNAIHYAQFLTNAFDWSFRELANVGIVGPNAFVKHEDSIVFLSNEGMYEITRGRDVANIGAETVNETILSTLELDAADRTVMHKEFNSNTIVCSYPRRGLDYNSQSVHFNYNTGMFTTSDIRIGGIIRLGRPNIVMDDPQNTAATSIAEFAATQPAAERSDYAAVETLPHSLDSPFWQGGVDSEFAYVDHQRNVIEHDVEGESLRARIEWPIINLDPKRKVEVNRILVNVHRDFGDANMNAALFVKFGDDIDNMHEEVVPLTRPDGSLMNVVQLPLDGRLPPSDAGIGYNFWKFSLELENFLMVKSIELRFKVRSRNRFLVELV